MTMNPVSQSEKWGFFGFKNFQSHGRAKLMRIFIRSKIDAKDMEYENIMNELWKIIRETHVMRGMK
jgi:hypothetical protein